MLKVIRLEVRICVCASVDSSVFVYVAYGFSSCYTITIPVRLSKSLSRVENIILQYQQRRLLELLLQSVSCVRYAIIRVF